jgi:hypothetical protein
MSQPPGPPPYGPPPGYGAPGPYVPPAAYGTPPRTAGPRRTPEGRSSLPWLLGAAALLAGFAVLLVLLLGDQGDEPSVVADLGSTASVEPVPPATSSAPAGADAGSGRFDGSGEVAQRWVDALAAGDFQTAFDLSCAEVQAAATASAEDGDGASSLGDYVFRQVLGVDGVRSATLDGVRYDAPSDTDVARFTLVADDGSSHPLAVYVISDGTVCDFR